MLPILMYLVGVLGINEDLLPARAGPIYSVAKSEILRKPFTINNNNIIIIVVVVIIIIIIIF
jgi:hypothetical protein